MRARMRIWGVAVTAAAFAASLSLAHADFLGLRLPFLDQDTTGTVPPKSSDWSGQSGASGHPLMTADAIRAAAANFTTCLEGLWPDAARRGVARKLFESHTAGLEPDLKIMDLLDAQPEFTKALWDYLDGLVSDARIKRGQEVLAQNKATFDPSRRPMASTAISSRRSGVSNRTMARRSANAR